MILKQPNTREQLNYPAFRMLLYGYNHYTKGEWFVLDSSSNNRQHDVSFFVYSSW